MPGAGFGIDLAQRHALGIDTYDMYCGHSSSFVAVDVAVTAQAFTRLFQEPELRQQLGAAGRERARSLYDWRSIIPKYEALWEQLGEVRKAQSPTIAPLSHPWPARLDPFHAFALYPTQVLSAQTRFALVDAEVQIAVRRAQSVLQLAMVNYSNAVLLSEAEINSVLEAVRTPKTAAEILQSIPDSRKTSVFRALVWLLKMHILQVVT